MFSLTLATVPSAAFSQFGERVDYFSPGLRIGYRFGDNGGFVVGAEVSVTRWWIGAFVGGVASVDYCNHTFSTHLGAEAGTWIVGFTIGPAVGFKNDSLSLGYYACAYTGAVVMPYYSRLHLPATGDMNEAGLFLKLPVQIGGSSRAYGLIVYRE